MYLIFFNPSWWLHAHYCPSIKFRCVMLATAVFFSSSVMWWGICFCAVSVVKEAPAASSALLTLQILGLGLESLWLITHRAISFMSVTPFWDTILKHMKWKANCSADQLEIVKTSTHYTFHARLNPGDLFGWTHCLLLNILTLFYNLAFERKMDSMFASVFIIECNSWTWCFNPILISAQMASPYFKWQHH